MFGCAPEFYEWLYDKKKTVVREGRRPTGIYDPAIAVTVQRILEAGREAVQSGCSTVLPTAPR